jgi:glycosyltransferase involved in cell wall biosynthesis
MSFKFIVNKFGKKYLLFILRKIQKMRVLSESIKRNIQALGYKGKIYVIANGIECSPILRSKNKESITRFLYFGVISESKGFGRVIKIFNELVSKGYNNFKLNIMGEWYSEYYRTVQLNYINSCSLKHFIHFHGKITGNEKWGKITENDYLIHLTDFDGQPLTIIETMSAGIPAIATEVGAIPEMIKHGKNGFIVKQSADITSLLIDIMDNNINWNILSENCKSTFEKHYTTVKMKDSIIQMVED